MLPSIYADDCPMIVEIWINRWSLVLVFVVVVVVTAITIIITFSDSAPSFPPPPLPLFLRSIGTVTGWFTHPELFGYEEIKKGFRVNGSTADNNSQILPFPPNLLEHPQQNLGIAIQFVRFINHNDRITTQERIGERGFSKEYPIGDVLDGCFGARFVIESYGVPDGFAEWGSYFVCDALGEGLCSNASWLGAYDGEAIVAPSVLKQILRDLCGLWY
jgi:hypothetical protein